MNVMAAIAGTGAYLPGQPIDNIELKKKISNFELDKARISLEKKGFDVASMTEDRIFDEWSVQVSGIRYRHFIDPNSADGVRCTEDMAREASLKALAAARIAPHELDFIVCGTFSQNHDIPNPACTIGHLIGADGVPGFPINTACSSFTDALGVAYYRIMSGKFKNILVVSSEHLTRHVDFSDPSTAILFGDGAAAAVVTASDHGIRSFFSKTQYSTDHILKEYARFIQMGGGPNVLKQAVNAMSEAAERAVEQAGVKTSDVFCMIPHQANLRIIQGVAKKLGIPIGKVAVTIEKYGNTSGSSLGIALDAVMRGEMPVGKPQRGDLLLLTVVGGGYTYSACVIEV